MSKINLNTDLSILLIRFSTALMFFHGLNKLLNGHDYIKQSLTEKGLPEILWIGVPIAEVLAPVLLLLGIFTRISGLLVAIVMLFSIYLAHSSDIFTINPDYGSPAIELNLLYFFAGLALFFSGGGKYALYQPNNKWLK